MQKRTWFGPFVVCLLFAVFVSIRSFGQNPPTDNRSKDPHAMLGDLYCTASDDGKTLHVWTIFTDVEKKDSDFMNGFIKSHEVRYIAAVASTERVGGGTIAFNTVLANNPVKIFDKAYLPGEEYRPQRVEIENFLRLR